MPPPRVVSAVLVLVYFINTSSNLPYLAALGITKSVSNISINVPDSQAMKDAALAATTAGLFMAASAGNYASSVATSPANEESVCTVGATANTDGRAWYSSYGPFVDVWAPGTGVLSTWPTNSTKSDSGTSMATPHIAGLAAYLIALEGTRTPVALCQRIKDLATSAVIVASSTNSNKLLAYNGIE